ncbi:MAG: hypothetical protein AAF462_06300 [Thermodesulfobacteriota bacterium]
MKSIYAITVIAILTIFGLASVADEEHHHHKHHAPHDGTLVVLGEEFAHLEFVLDKETGNITIYVLDGEAENPIRIEQQSIELKIVTKEDNSKTQISILEFNPVSNVLTGEKKGDSSEFSAQSDQLKNQNSFDAVISEITVSGVEFKQVEFGFPEGNE